MLRRPLRCFHSSKRSLRVSTSIHSPGPYTSSEVSSRNCRILRDLAFRSSLHFLRYSQEAMMCGMPRLLPRNASIDCMPSTRQ